MTTTAAAPSVTTRHLGDDLRIVSFCSDAASSHLLVHRGQSLLIDCHSAELAGLIAGINLPRPGRVVHTHVQPEHCREGQAFIGARVGVPGTLVDLACDSEVYRRDCRTVWEKPGEWMITRGREAYGVGGSVTLLPPDPPLQVQDTFAPGDVLSFGEIELQVIDLPGHSRDGVGFLLHHRGTAKALFSGDLLRNPACLVNVYDLENGYGLTTLDTLPEVLERVASLGVELFLPATGPVIEKGPQQARQLAEKIRAYHQALAWRPSNDDPAPRIDYPVVGRWLQLHRGVYQINNFGNCIVLIDDAGHGLFVDPGPCDYESPTRLADFQRDLDVLHERCGLKVIDLALVTHFHGDHYDCYPQLKQRYPQCKLAAWEPVARVLEAPQQFPYPCTLPWYNLGLDAMTVDVKLSRREPFAWRGVSIQTEHLPGHCLVHAAYLLSFNGLRLAITGDSIQARGESESINFIIANDSVPDDRDGCLAAYQTMLRHEVDLNLGGHGAHFTDCRRLYRNSLTRMQHAQPALRALLHDGDLTRAFRRPWFPPFQPIT